MPNEREVKRRARGGEARCSVTGRRCQCESGSGCQTGRPRLDDIPVETVRQLRAATIYLEAAKNILDTVEQPYKMSRKFPGPEVREISRKVTTALSMLDEIGGEL